MDHLNVVVKFVVELFQQLLILIGRLCLNIFIWSHTAVTGHEVLSLNYINSSDQI